MPGIVSARGSSAASPRFWARPCSATQPVMPSPTLTRSWSSGLVDVLADLALHGDRDDVVALDPVDPDVVVVDELAQLGRDGLPDLVHAGQPVQACPQLLDRPELRGPRGHPLEVLGRADRHARLGREGGHRLEVVLGPGVRSVVIDDEEPEQLGAVEERRGADGVVALLDHGRTHALTARVVAIVDREHRSTCGDRERGQGAGRELADAPEVARREAPTHLGDDASVRPLQEHGGAIGFEQDHRVIDQTGQDPVEVEPAADVARDPMERLRAMKLAGDLLPSSGDRDDRPDGVGHDRGHVGIALPDHRRGIGDEVEDAPRPAEGGDRDRQLGSFARQDGQRRTHLVRAGRGATAARSPGIVGIRGIGERRPEHAERAEGDRRAVAERPRARARRPGPSGDRHATPRSRPGAGRRRFARG